MVPPVPVHVRSPCPALARSLETNLPRGLVKRTLSSVVFRNMSSEEPDDTPGAPQLPDDEPLNLTDPRAMRALAHPMRIALIELLGVEGTITATQASEILGESPANCAFHLRTLA